MQRPKNDKRIMVAIAAGAFLLLTATGVLNILSAKQARDTVSRQFNEEQLAVAHYITHHIETALEIIKEEIARLSSDLSDCSLDPVAIENVIQRSSHRVLDTGVRQIEIADVGNKSNRLATPLRNQTGRQMPGRGTTCPGSANTIRDLSVWVAASRTKPNEMILNLSAPLESPSGKQVLFHVNITWFLTRFLKGVRSGKTGYAWIIDDNGTFLYHPDRAFIGKNAFSVRKETYPDISFGKINFIQKEKMLKGHEGTGWYFSGWHHGVTGDIKKLIAYSPIVITDAPPRKWSVAVVVPAAEIEEAINKGYRFQLALHGLIVVVIGLGTFLIIRLERRWSAHLKNTVVKKTTACQRSEEKYRSLVESAEDFIFTLDAQGCFQSMNSYTAGFFGGKRSEFVHKHLSFLFSEAVTLRQMQHVRYVFQNGKSVSDKIEIGMGQQSIWIHANFMPLKKENGAVTAVLCIARDITESKNLERQLVNTEKLASLGTLAAGVAHEVNNPLGVMLGFCDLLLEKTDRSTQAYQDLKTIERQGLHCKEVVENLLSFSRHKTGTTEYSDINRCLKEIIAVVKHTLEMHDIELETDLTDSIPSVRGDYRQLQQVFLNLINNAVAAMRNGQRLLKIKTRYDRKSRRARIDVSDTGIGIAPEHLEQIFEPFFTTKPEGEGTGLGLFVSYGIVTNFGGSLSCDRSTMDTPDHLGKPKGTTFIVRLPVKRGEA